jgi:hypothetical protein
VTRDVIAHYRIRAPLGEGGMGAVYVAHDERLDREVAIKVLKHRGDAEAVDRFFREARAASALNHPNIVTVFDAGESEQGYFIVMELVRGRDLRSLIGQPLGRKRLTSLTRQIAEALSVAHEAGIVHRDIKPDNIMVRDDGYLKVLDFGLARLATLLTSTTETESGGIVGTIRYMSPEQTVESAVGPPSDMFSLGVVLYELATGRHPFDAESAYGVLHAIVSHQPIPPSRLNPELPPDLESLILRMLDKDPSRRPTAAAVTMAMDTAIPGTAVRVPSAAEVPKRHSVGRLKARADLHAALEYVGARRGLLLCVSGEPGIGKSTLVDDFLAQLSESSAGCHVARGRCSERLAGTEAYLPLLDALANLLRSDDGALARLMKTVAPLWYAQVTPAALQPPSAEDAVAQIPAGTQERLKRELVAFLTDACRQKPIIVFFDDLQWVDISTVDLLGYVARQFESLPLLIIVTYRPEELLVKKHPFLSTKHDLQSRGLCREIALEFLTHDDVEQYVALKFPDHRLPRSFVDVIFAKTEGNPLFVADLLSYLSEQRVLSRVAGQWTLTRPVPDIARELPESVRGMIQRKIDTLSEADRRILLAASVQGYEFDGAIVAAVLRIDPADIEDQLDHIDRIHGFVRRVRELEYADGTLTLRYRFVHVLYQNLLYASLTPARKTALSREIGKALEAFYRDHTGDIASELAVLYETAREFKRATAYFLVAAQHAARMFAYEEALVLGRRALGALQTLPDGPERQRQELAILMSIGVAATVTSGYSSQDVEEIYARASTLSVEFHEIEQLALALWRLFAFNITRLRLEAAQKTANQLGSLARDSHDSRLVVQSALARGLVAHFRGQFRTATKRLERAERSCTLDLRRSMCDTLGYDPAVSAHAYIGSTRWCLGYPDGAVQSIEAALAATADLAHAYTLVHGLHFACVIDGWRGDWEQLRIHNERALAVTVKERFSYFTATASFFEGVWLAHLGRRDEGLVRMRAGWTNLRAIEARVSQQRFATEFAEQLSLAGRPREALDVVTTEIDAMRTDRCWEAELWRAKGELLLMLGEPSGAAEAEVCFQRAVRIARRQRAKSLELRAMTSLSRLWHVRGKSTEAGLRLSETYGWFTEGFETADLTAARRLLADIGTAAASRPG